MTTLSRLCGPPLALDGATALDLTGRGEPLFIRSGSLNVFAAAPGGRRSLLFRCGAGELVFGLPPVDERRVLAVATLGTEVVELDCAAVDALPEAQRQTLLAMWLRRLGAEPGALQTAALPAAHLDACARFAAAIENQDAHRAGSIGRSWAQTADGYKRALGALAQLVRDAGGAEPVDPRHGERQSIRHVAHGPALDPEPHHADGDASAALRAVRTVAAAMQIDADLAPGLSRGAPLDELLAGAGVCSRTVLLRGDWWRRDSGPLIVFDEARQPLAALPNARGYRIHDEQPAGRPVDEQVAQGLAADALMLYRPLPGASLDRQAMLRFGVHGLSGDLAVLALAGLAASLLGLLIPLATGWLVESVIPRGDFGEHWQLVWLLLAGALGAAGFELCKALTVLRMETRVDLAMQAALFDRLLRLPLGFFRHFAVADLADRALGVQEIRNILSVTASSALLGAIFSVSSLGAMLFYSPPLALAGLVVVALVLALTAHAARRQLRHQAEQVRHRGAVEGLVLQFVTGVGKLRAAAAEQRALAAWARSYREQTRRFAFVRRSAMVQELVQGCAPPLASLLIFTAVWWSIGRASAPAPGPLLAFLAAYGQFLAAMTGMTMALTQALQAVPLWRRLQPLLEQQPEGGAGRRSPAAPRGAIEFREVSFRYGDSGPAILDRASLNIEPGQFVAIVGPSGSGKSTLLRLMMGLETPASGEILFDGQPLAGLDAGALRRRIGVVLQNGRVSAGSVFTNIAGGQRISHAEALEAARQVGFAHEIEAMPMGLHTVLQDGAGTLSGGQRQRLLLARALARKPALLLLDEATSALDNRTQATLMDSLSRLALTRVMVAHRLSTVMAADQILVVDGGRIVQRGTYDELMAQQGLFAQLARRQLP
jgi:NHLM bacteriocin system ABC transporter ATP-binding protein